LWDRAGAGRPVPTALKVGDSIPDVTLRTVDNQEVKLRTLVAEKATGIIRFAYADTDFKVRLAASKVLEAAKIATQ
jgi:hypothetical protein